MSVSNFSFKAMVGSLLYKILECLRGILGARRNGCPPAPRSNANSRHNGKPIRLIDVRATITTSDKGNICFKVAHDWNFHIISHVWSVGVRSLSERIGKQISTQLPRCNGEGEEGQQEAPDAYSQAFKQADFSNDPCYQQLVEFFRLLASEGVEQIWFDALCIDQTNEDEKSTEIPNMAAYYSRSKACYVLTHGVGEGFQLFGKTEAHLSLPPWFTRAWTFQEFLFSERLIFIVEGLDKEFVRLVNQLVSKNCLCRCYTKIPWVDLEAPKWSVGFELQKENWAFKGEESHNKRELVNDGGIGEQKPDKQRRSSAGKTSDEDKIDVRSEDPDQTLGIRYRCAKCHSLLLIRTAHIPNHSSQSQQIYFVDREAYLGVMQSHAFMRFPGNELNEPPWKDERNAALRPLWSLYRSLSRKVFNYWTPFEVITAVGNRYCTREEDRVLSILGLLRVELLQLRTGKGLAKQVVELAKACSPEMLIELCGMDAKACCTVGMSWAPDFQDPSSHRFWSTHVLPELQEEQQLEVAVERQQVCVDGSIKLLAKVVSGHLLAITALPATIRVRSRTKTATYRQSYPHSNDTEQPTHFIVVPMLNSNTTTHLELFQQIISLESCCFIPLDLYAAKTDQSTLMLHFAFNWQTGASHGGSFYIPIGLDHTRDSLTLQDLTVSFPIQMVLLGGAPTTIGGRFNVIMLCVSKAAGDGEGEEELHKVGMLYLTQPRQEWGMQMNLFEKASPRECLIGGFGGDLGHNINLEHDITGEVCILEKPPMGSVPIRKSW